nr:reverse transcriptase domain-containing protein [Tanacetum cinerariifolium]
MMNTRSGMTPTAIEGMINRRLTKALETHEANKNIGLGNGSWRELMKLMAEVYCPRTETQKMESELNVIAAKLTRLQDAVRMANNIMDQKLKDYAMKNSENKRKFKNSQKDNHGHQPPFKRQNVRGQNVARAYTTENDERRVYNGPLPLCNKCKFHQEGPCTVRCGKCNKVRHLTRDCKATNSTTSTQRGQVVNQNVVSCYECERQGHYRSDCPKLKDQNYGNKSGNKNGIDEARGKAYVLGGGDANPDSNFITELGSFDVIIDMDWLANHHAVIVSDEKIVRNPYGDEVLIVQGNRNGKGKKSKLSIISCTKTQKYIKKGCLIFLAQVMKKETKDKSEEKRLKDVPTRRDFPKVFPKDFPGLPPTRKVEFQIDLVPGAASVSEEEHAKHLKLFWSCLRRKNYTPSFPSVNFGFQRRFLEDCQTYDEADSEEREVRMDRKGVNCIPTVEADVV